MTPYEIELKRQLALALANAEFYKRKYLEALQESYRNQAQENESAQRANFTTGDYLWLKRFGVDL